MAGKKDPFAGMFRFNREPGSDDDAEEYTGPMTTVGALLETWDLGGVPPRDPVVSAEVDAAFERMDPAAWKDCGGAPARDAYEAGIELAHKWAAHGAAMRDEADKEIELLRSLDLDTTQAERKREIGIGIVSTGNRAALRLENTPPTRLPPAGSIYAFVGAVDRPCKLCGKPVWVVTNAQGKRDAFDAFGGKHSAICKAVK